MRPFMFSALTLCVCICLLGFSAAALAGSPYDDVPTDHWAYAALDYLSKADLLEGYPEGFFDPTSAGFHDGMSGPCVRLEFNNAVAKLIDGLNTGPKGELDDQARCIARGLLAEFSDQFADVPAYLSKPSRVNYHFRGFYDDVPLDHWSYSVLNKFQQRGLLDNLAPGYFDGKHKRTLFEISQASARVYDELDSTKYADPIDRCLAEGLRAEVSIQVHYPMSEDQLKDYALEEAQPAGTAPPQELASATVLADGLEYRLEASYSADNRGYEFTLRIRNTTNAPVILQYPTGERFDFEVAVGTEDIWNLNHNRFFVQQVFSDSLGAQQEAVYSGRWNGLDNSYQPFDAPKFSLRAVHASSSHPLTLVIDGLPTATGVSTTSSPNQTSAYDDVPQGHWAYQALASMCEEGYLDGYPDDFFDGERVLTRYEIAQSIRRLEDLIASGRGIRNPLVPILTQLLSAEFADTLASIGRVNPGPGGESGGAAPGAQPTEWLAGISESTPHPPPSNQVSMSAPVPLDHWAYDAVSALVRKRMLDGFPAGYFDGQRVLTRYEFVQAVARLRDTIDSLSTPADPLVLALTRALETEFADELAYIYKRLSELDAVDRAE